MIDIHKSAEQQYKFNFVINTSSKQMFLVYFTVLHSTDSNHRKPQFQIWKEMWFHLLRACA